MAERIIYARALLPRTGRGRHRGVFAPHAAFRVIELRRSAYEFGRVMYHDHVPALLLVGTSQDGGLPRSGQPDGWMDGALADCRLVPGSAAFAFLANPGQNLRVLQAGKTLKRALLQKDLGVDRARAGRGGDGWVCRGGPC